MLTDSQTQKVPGSSLPSPKLWSLTYSQALAERSAFQLIYRPSMPTTIATTCEPTNRVKVGSELQFKNNIIELFSLWDNSEAYTGIFVRHDRPITSS